jgi:hypothetical protein
LKRADLQEKFFACTIRVGGHVVNGAMNTNTRVLALVLMAATFDVACNDGGNGSSKVGDGSVGGGGAIGDGASGGGTTSGGSGGGGTSSGGSGGGGGAGGSSSFKAAVPPSDVCAMLTLADVQAIFPNARPGVEQPTADTSAAGFWARDCKWDLSDTSTKSLELVVFGALTQDGLLGIKLAAQSGSVNNPVSGVGDEAHYWEDGTNGTNGLWALKAPYSVDTTAYFFTPFPTADQFKPLVVKALGQLN